MPRTRRIYRAPGITNSPGGVIETETINYEEEKKRILAFREFNAAVAVIKPEIVKSEIWKAYPGDVTIVSIGSGDGRFEQFLQELGGNSHPGDHKFILIDPHPGEWVPYVRSPGGEKVKIYLQPDYKNTSQCLRNLPDIKCVLLLNWTYPGTSSYDVRAIKKFKPLGIIIIYEAKGAAGSNKLHDWLRDPRGYEHVRTREVLVSLYNVPGTFGMIYKLSFFRKI